MSRAFSCVLGLLLAIPLASGCARAKAKTAPENPPLDMPAPPPRDVEINDTEPPPPIALPQEPARNPTPRTRPPATREQPRVEPPKPTPPPPEPPPVVEAPPDEPVRPPPATLQTIPSNAEGEVERAIRGMLSRASDDLSKINYQRLNSEARTQYETAKSFIRQAEAALRAKNLVIARNLADKAATLATQLGGSK